MGAVHEASAHRLDDAVVEVAEPDDEVCMAAQIVTEWEEPSALPPPPILQRTVVENPKRPELGRRSGGAPRRSRSLGPRVVPELGLCHDVGEVGVALRDGVLVGREVRADEAHARVVDAQADGRAALVAHDAHDADGGDGVLHVADVRPVAHLHEDADEDTDEEARADALVRVVRRGRDGVEELLEVSQPLRGALRRLRAEACDVCSAEVHHLLEAARGGKRGVAAATDSPRERIHVFPTQ